MPPELKVPVKTPPQPKGKPPEARGDSPVQWVAIQTLWTPEEAAGYLKVSPDTMANWRTSGDGPRFLRPPKTRIIRYPAVECQRWIESGGLVSSTTEADAQGRIAAKLAAA